MTGLVTKETNRSVTDYIDNIGNKSKINDSYVLLELIKEITGMEPKVWGNDKVPDFIIGFGNYTYHRKGKKEAFEWFNIGFAPRINKITIYLTYDINKEKELLQKLGSCNWGKGCLYLKKLEDIDLNILKELIKKSKDGH